VLMYAYIVLSLLARLRTEEARALSWQHVNWTATRKPILPSRPMWPCGDRCDCTAKLRLSGHAARSLFPRWRQQRSGRCRKPEGRTAPGR